MNWANSRWMLVSIVVTPYFAMGHFRLRRFFHFYLFLTIWLLLHYRCLYYVSLFFSIWSIFFWNMRLSIIFYHTPPKYPLNKIASSTQLKKFDCLEQFFMIVQVLYNQMSLLINLINMCGSRKNLPNFFLNKPVYLRLNYIICFKSNPDRNLKGSVDNLYIYWIHPLFVDVFFHP